MKIKRMSLGPLGTNCYLVYDDKNALVIDPGGDADAIINFLQATNIVPKAILLTHAHFDHIGGVEKLRNHYPIDVYLHENEKSWLSDSSLNRSLYFDGAGFSTKDPEQSLEAGEMQLSSFHFEVIHTPGHSPGSVSFIFAAQQFVISGDALFQNGIGRTDLPGGNYEQLEASIRQGLYQLPDDFIVYSGHGPETTIGNEKRNNPFVHVR